MSYYLPFQGKTRFIAFEDTPEIEALLKDFLLSDPTWEKLESNTVLMDSVVDGVSRLGVSFRRGMSFVSTDSGYPQVDFDLNPNSLLFAYGYYNIDNSSQMSFSGLQSGIVRAENSTSSYIPTDENLDLLWEQIRLLENLTATKKSIEIFQSKIDAIDTSIKRLREDGSQTSTILSYISSEEFSRREQDIALRNAIDQMEAELNEFIGDITGQEGGPEAVAIFNINSYPTKSQVLSMIANFATREYVSAFINNKLDENTFLNHLQETNPHGVTAIDVGSPTLSDITVLMSSLNAAVLRLNSLEGSAPVKTITGVNGILAVKTGNTYKIDGSQLLETKYPCRSEVVFYQGGSLTLESGMGKWSPWNECAIIGVKVSLGEASQGNPVVIDINKDGDTIYEDQSARPVLLEGETYVVADLPSDVSISPGEHLTIDIDNIGTNNPGTDLTVQIRYEEI